MSLSQSESEKHWLNRLAPLTARRRLQAREWVLGEFWILYYRSSRAVYLASARHEREAEYRSSAPMHPPSQLTDSLS